MRFVDNQAIDLRGVLPREALDRLVRGDSHATLPAPPIKLEVAVIARPTSSRSLYVQMVGRVLRLHPGKHRALVIDVVGASHGMTLASAADLSTSSEAEAAKRDAGARAGAAGATDRVSYSIKIVSRWFAPHKRGVARKQMQQAK